MIAVLGAGAFGTALAAVLAGAGRDVVLIGRDAAAIAEVGRDGENARRLPGVALPESLRASADLGEIGRADLVLFAAPAQETRALGSAVRPHLGPAATLVACAKGLERGGGARQTEVLGEMFPGQAALALSGPGFAAEIARGKPTAMTLAASDLGLAREVAARLSTPSFRLYASDDPLGVELGGALKNVLAIACGAVIGQGLGESARAALIARGLAEMMRLGAALGARRETLMGLSGLGDLVLTATSEASRNMRFGMRLGRGESVAGLSAAGEPLAEGAATAAVAAALAAARGVDMPIVAAVAAVIEGREDVGSATRGLIGRPLTVE